MENEKKLFGMFLIEKLQIENNDWIKIDLNPEIEKVRISNGRIGQEDFCVPKNNLSNKIRPLIEEYFKEINGSVIFRRPEPYALDFHCRINNLKGYGVITSLNNKIIITITTYNLFSK